MSALIPIEALKQFENAIYFPMLIQILENDLALVDKSPIKLKRPYALLIEEALKIIRAEYKETNAYLRQHKMKLNKGKTDELFTEYFFIYKGYEDARKYLNLRLKNRSEELMGMYFAMTNI